MFGFLRKKKKETPKQAVKTNKVQSNETHIDKKETTVPKKRKAVIHITKHKSGGWQVKKEGAQRALKLFKTQKEAIDFAKTIESEKGTGYIIHKTDGSTRKKKY
jgi:uncharacterized protein YdaT